MRATLQRLVPQKKEFFRILWITTAMFPLFLMMRGKYFSDVAVDRYVREFFFLFLVLGLSTKLLYVFHFSIARPLRFRRNLNWQILAEILFIIITTPLIVTLIFRILFPEFFMPGKDWRMPIFILFITWILEFVYLYYFHFLDSQQRFREAVKDQERLRFEKITAQYKALQNHISPHFIFNCLGGIDALIRERPADASRVIHNLSDCLQHILITLEKNIISLEEELSFISKYEQLLQIRFPDSISINVFIDKTHLQKKIPPCLLQMLVENAVKHNAFDPARKLNIIISSLDGDRLSVSNNCNSIQSGEGPVPMGTGLENIRQRFLLLTQEPVQVKQTDKLFTATLPLLNC